MESAAARLRGCARLASRRSPRCAFGGAEPAQSWLIFLLILRQHGCAALQRERSVATPDTDAHERHEHKHRRQKLMSCEMSNQKPMVLHTTASSRYGWNMGSRTWRLCVETCAKWLRGPSTDVWRRTFGHHDLRALWAFRAYLHLRRASVPNACSKGECAVYACQTALRALRDLVCGDGKAASEMQSNTVLSSRSASNEQYVFVNVLDDTMAV